MNYSASVKTNPVGLAAAIEDWWYVLMHGLERPLTSRRPPSPSGNAAVLPFRSGAVWCWLACLLVIGAAVAVAWRQVETTDWPWLLVDIVLKVVGWL